MGGRRASFLTKEEEKGGRFERVPNFFSFYFLCETGSEVKCSGEGEGAATRLVERDQGSEELAREWGELAEDGGETSETQGVTRRSKTLSVFREWVNRSRVRLWLGKYNLNPERHGCGSLGIQ